MYVYVYVYVYIYVYVCFAFLKCGSLHLFAKCPESMQGKFYILSSSHLTCLRFPHPAFDSGILTYFPCRAAHPMLTSVSTAASHVSARFAAYSLNGLVIGLSGAKQFQSKL